jgi:hypothetical protein
MLLREVYLYRLQSFLAGAVSMNYIQEILEKLEEWANKLMDLLLGPDVQVEPELIPIPVKDKR